MKLTELIKDDFLIDKAKIADIEIENITDDSRTKGSNILFVCVKGITLAVIDNAWKEHLRDLDDLKQSVQNASYEQKDPLLIYKLESFNLFDQLLTRISTEIVSFLTKGSVPISDNSQVKEAQLPESDAKKLQTGIRPR